MKVKELIKILKRLPQENKVEVDGCDCKGDAHGAEVHRWDDGVVIIFRENGNYVQGDYSRKPLERES